MGFIPRPNRKYSTTIYQAASSGDTTLYVNAVPSNVPCILLIEPGTAKEEKVKCTAKSTNTITVTRGYGGTTATDHSLGSTIVDYNAIEYITEIADVLDANFNASGVLTSSNAQLTTPKVTTSINDANGNEVIKTPATASAVNEVTVTNAATGNAPQIAASGGDTNIDLQLKGKGTGTVQKPVSTVIQVAAPDSDLTTGDGKFYFTVPPELNGMVLSAVHARVITAGTTGTTDIQLHNVTDTVDMLSTKLTIDSGETGSDTAATPAIIDTANDDVATNDLIRIDIDAISTTAPKGLVLRLSFNFP